MDPRVVQKFCDLLSEPLELIFSKVYETVQWPKSWKSETVTLIPKKSSPTDLSQVRNLSCTPLFSKLLESFILEELRAKIPIHKVQFGGIKGTGIDHFLAETWTEILETLEEGSAGVAIMSVDFEKAFNRMSHQECISVLKKKGAHPQAIALVNAFLFQRTMSVRIGNIMSVPKMVNGGSPQGSILGNYLFCQTTECLAGGAAAAGAMPAPPAVLPDGVELEIGAGPEMEIEESLPASQGADDNGSDRDWESPERSFNFFRPRINRLEDTMLSERFTREQLDAFFEEDEDYEDKIPSVKIYIDDFNIIEKVPLTNTISHISNEKTRLLIHASRCQRMFEDIDGRATNIKMKVNPLKTQLLCIGPDTRQTLEPYIRPNGIQITGQQELKVLGFHFSSRPDISLHITKTLQKFRMRLWGLRKLKSARAKPKDLLDYYSTVVRPVAEFAAGAICPMVTGTQSEQLEALQARAMKVVFGPTVSYGTVLEGEIVDTLKSRREKAHRKLAEKSVLNPRFSDTWFPLNVVDEEARPTRNRKTYAEFFARTERLRNAPIYSMRRILNE